MNFFSWMGSAELSSWTSWLSSSFKCSQGLPEGLLLQCLWDSPGQPNSSLIPFRSLRVSQQRGPLPRTSLCLEMYLHRASPSPAVPRCPLRGWGDLVLIFCGFSITLKYDCLQMFQPMCKLPVNSVPEMRKCCQQLDFHVSLHTHLHITTIKYDFQELFFSNLEKCLSNISAFFCVIFF